jgi:hypothetical protein
MKPITAATAVPRTSSHRWIRQVHLWIGAWGALAAVVYGFTGLVMNHRFGDGAWPQGDSKESGRVVLALPEAARATPEALVAWLQQQHGLQAQVVRKGPPGGARLGDRDVQQPAKWTLSGGSARASWSLDYVPGNATADVKQSRHTALAAFNRLHKGVGGGWAWRLLADSFAIGMVLLGLWGLWMGARGRCVRRVIVSVLGLSSLALALVLGAALGS